MNLLIVPGFLDVMFAILGVLSALFLIFFFYRILVLPALIVRAELDTPPPSEGYELEILLDDHHRVQTIKIGQLDCDIMLRLNGITDDHLYIKVEKERDLEEYDITATAWGPVHYRPPHARNFENLNGSESFNGRELIGYPSVFRLAASIRENRLIQYVEFTLSQKYIINKFGEEKSAFYLTLTRIFPSVDKTSRNKEGLYLFGRVQRDSDEEEVTEEAKEG